MPTIDDQSSGPSWLDAENDESHKAEIAPLFGTGQVSLIDDESKEEHEPEEADEEKPLLFSPGSKYGSLIKNFGKADRDDNDDKAEGSVITATSNASSKASSKKQKGGARSIVVTESGKPEFPRRPFLLTCFHFIEGFGIISSLCLLVTQILPVIFVPFEEIGLMSFALKVYVSLFCVLFVMLEWNVPIGFLKDATFLQNYFSRGFLYSFLGLSCLEEAYSERVKEMVAHSKDQFHVAWFSLFMQLSSWGMLGLGVFYMLLGLCCLKVVRDKMATNYRERWETYKEALKIYQEENP